MSKLDVLLVNPSNRKETYQNLSASYAAHEPPIWAGLLASFLRVKGLSVQILDTGISTLGHADNAQLVSDISPTLVAIVCYGQQPSASTLVMPGARALAQELKNIDPKQKIIFVGGHVAALPERTLTEEPCDFVCDGEGPYTLFELVTALKELSPNFSKVRGLLYKDSSGNIVHTPSAPLVQDLDNEMPGVAWDLLPVEKYVAHNWQCFGRLNERNNYAALYSSLGCPFSCSFCCIQAPFRTGEKVLGYSENVHTQRRWSAKTIISQIDYLVKNHNISTIKFADELFLMNNAQVHEICNTLIERKYNLHCFCNTRIDTWTPELLELLRAAGFEWMPLSVESGSKRVLESVNKKISIEQAFKTREAFKKFGIYALGHYLYGLPEDDMESMQQTAALAKELNCEFANIYSAMAYPGSKLYIDAINAGWKLPDSWNGYSQHAYDTLPLPTKYLTGQEVLAFRDHAFKTYFSDNDYLDSIENIFGNETKEHIIAMNAYDLPRKYLENFKITF